MTNDDQEFVMPIVICKSNGGPLDDHAFVAGCYMGEISAEVRMGLGKIERYVPTDIVPQVDMLAMHHGWHMHATPWDEHPDEWTLIVLDPNPIEGGDDR